MRPISLKCERGKEREEVWKEVLGEDQGKEHCEMFLKPIICGTKSSLTTSFIAPDSQHSGAHPQDTIQNI